MLFAYNIIAFIIPISGVGLHQSLLRYGALLKTTEEKKQLFTYTFYKGISATLLLIVVIIITTLFIDFQFKETTYYIALFAFSLLPMYVFELIKVLFRLFYNNKLFALAEVIFTLFLTITVFLLSYLYQEKGYAFALVLTPILSVLFLYRKFATYFTPSKKLNIVNWAFWKYGAFASLSNVVTQLLFVIDILLIGILLEDPEMVTNYKYVSLIPLSLLFLPRAFINTDFVAFTEHIYNKKYIVKYIKSYMLLFSLLSIFFCIFFVFFSEWILRLFDNTFIQYNSSFLILIVGIFGILIFRGLFGNLLSSIGKAHINFYITSVALILNMCSNYFLIPIYGIKGAAITSATLMWLTGIASTIIFWQLYNNRFLKATQE